MAAMIRRAGWIVLGFILIWVGIRDRDVLAFVLGYLLFVATIGQMLFPDLFTA